MTIEHSAYNVGASETNIKGLSYFSFRPHSPQKVKSAPTLAPQ